VIFTKLNVSKGVEVCTLTPNFTIMVLKMWAYSPENRQNC